MESSEVRPAATILALRRATPGFEVLMVRRSREARFMGGAHVFPGGGVDEADHGPAAAAVVNWSGNPDEFPWRAAALRELAEEAGLVLGDPAFDSGGVEGADLYRRLADSGVHLDADALEYVGNWVTPRGLHRRYDTRFYVVEVPADSVARTDRNEVYDAVWVEPRQALQAAAAGRWYVEVPTRAHLEMLAGCSDMDTALQTARDAVPERIEPRIGIAADGNRVVLLPGDPGFEEAGG